MIWWIDFFSNFLLCLFFLYLILRPLILRKPFVLSSAVYCSMIMLGLLILSLNDYMVLSSGSWNNAFTHWRGFLFVLGFPLYLFLIPRIRREFYVFHVSESVFREKTIAYLRQAKIPYAIDPDKLSIRSESDNTFVSFYNPTMRYAVWVFNSCDLDLVNARKQLKYELSKEKPYTGFSWHVVSFFLIFSILLLRMTMMIVQKVNS